MKPVADPLGWSIAVTVVALPLFFFGGAALHRLQIEAECHSHGPHYQLIDDNVCAQVLPSSPWQTSDDRGAAGQKR